MRCEEVQQLFSALIDEHLDTSQHEQVWQHLQHCRACSAELAQLRQFVEFCRQLEAPEPRLDLWREFQPILAVILAERRLSLRQRLQRQWARFVSQVCYGIILFLQVVTYQVTVTLSRYILEPDRVASYTRQR